MVKPKRSLRLRLVVVGLVVLRPRTGLGSLVATLTGKGKKASVLDKSKEDWDKFKETDGKEFVHDMEQAKKDGCAFSCLIVVSASSPPTHSFPSPPRQVSGQSGVPGAGRREAVREGARPPSQAKESPAQANRRVSVNATQHATRNTQRTMHTQNQTFEKWTSNSLWGMWGSRLPVEGVVEEF